MRVVAVILWLSFSLSALAQNAPMRTVPMQSVPADARGVESGKSFPSSTQSASTQPCWERPDRQDPQTCLSLLLQEIAGLDRDIVDLAVKDSSDETDRSMLYVKRLKRKVLVFLAESLVSRNNLPTAQIEHLKPAPQVESTQPVEQRDSSGLLLTRPANPGDNRPDSGGWRKVTPQEEEKKGNCWEETNPADPIGCFAQIEIAKIELESQKTNQNKKSIKKEIRKLAVHKKRIERQVKAKLDLAERQEKHQESEQKALNLANISCPQGQTEPVRILSVGHFKKYLWQAFQAVTITNPHNFTVRISALDGNSQKAGDVVDLPAFCTITVTRSLDVWGGEAGRVGGVYYSYAAQPLHVENFQGIARSPQYYLYPGNNFGQARADPWVIGRFQMNY